MNHLPNQWMAEQSRLARSTYLIFDSEGERETYQALLALEPTPNYISVYAQTPISAIATGPLILQISSAMKPLLNSLLDTPERNWGWLVSCKGDQLTAMAEHWRARIIIGQRPEQSLYRFHDNRVLARALNHLKPEALPEYLGPIAGVLYWDGMKWTTVENPSPGVYPVPSNPGWLGVPAPVEQSRAILLTNIERYVRAEHAEEIYELEQRTYINAWINKQLDDADLWNWHTPEQLQFLVTQRLKEEKGAIIESWLPKENETPQQHFDRIYKEATYWAGGN
ncbi:DUF4123 domain-containing protein [Pseudomonas sp.]|uniref:DUF4123 domain-containing protein n=1 Tax=Pseudomonas sp. TaxID=306 RepID=UPI00261B3291|nr:DUF4123 domain-containing protein [Pseudomonas sp.]